MKNYFLSRYASKVFYKILIFLYNRDLLVVNMINVMMLNDRNIEYRSLHNNITVKYVISPYDLIEDANTRVS